MNIQISNLNTTKNLLAFSSGVDSTALFFILLENNTPFDIAIVNYNQREQSKEEIKYAKELAKKYNKKIYTKDVKLNTTSNFEKNARDIRYNFFEEIITQEHYETLITAHQLNDKLEWFLMQFSQGAGLVELIGLEEYTYKETYQIFRPLLQYTKEELEIFLSKKDIKYFIDESNFDEKYTRNYFRKNFSNELLHKFKNGIQQSFKYLENDLNSLNIDYKPIYKEKELEVFKHSNDYNIDIRVIDVSLKKRGILLSKKQRDEILKQKELVISHKIAISIVNEYIFISPYENVSMDKKFKELCRIKKIPKNIRAYLYKDKIEEIFNFLKI
jgi:tRNA(Ile)-lysidine synthase